MRKEMTVFALALILCGCGPQATEKPTPEQKPAEKVPDTLIAKRDASKDYVFASPINSSALRKALEANGRSSELDFFANFDSDVMANTKKNLLDSETITFNFDSVDANALQKDFDKEAKAIADVQQEALASINSKKHTFTWQSQTLVGYQASKDTAAVLINKLAFAYASDAISNHYVAYNFDLKTGKLMTTQEALAKVGLSFDQVVARIQEDFTKNPVTLDGQTVTRSLNVKKDAYDNRDYRLLPQDSIYVSEHEIIVPLANYSGLDGDFATPELYRIKL